MSRSQLTVDTRFVSRRRELRPGRPLDPAAALVELEHKLASAWVTGDRPFIEALLAQDWTVTDPSGKVLSRQQVLDEAFVTSDRSA